MIPLSSDMVYSWKDDRDGSVIEILPTVGTNELLLYEAFDKISVNPAPFLPAAELAVDAETKGKKFKAGERKKMIIRRASEMANESRGNLSASEMKDVYKAINVFVKACVLSDGTRIEFKNDAAERFNLESNMRLISAIADVNNLTGEDKKN